MTNPTADQPRPVRLIVRVHVPSVSPYEVADIQEGIRLVLTEYPTAEVESSMVPIMPSR